MILSAFFAAMAQMGDPRFRGVLIKGVGLTILLLLGLYALVFYGMMFVLPETVNLFWIGEVRVAQGLISSGSVVLVMILSVFLMVPVASAFTGIFLDDVADAVEARHYPHLGPAPVVSLTDNILESIKFLGVILIANLGALVLYFTPFAPFVFYALNGYLLGREYFRMIAVRRLGRADAGRVFRANLLTVWTAGALMAVPLSIPILNLVIPILGAATFTHLYHRVSH